MTCVSDESLLAFVEGRVTPQSVSGVEAHLLACDACLSLLTELLRSQIEKQSNEPLASRGRVGRYEVLNPIGVGGMGVVYEARDPQLDRRVAVKMLRASAAASETAAQLRERILREAQAMARLSHPNILTVYDVGVTGDAVFLAMELVEGGTLTEWLRERRRSWREVLHVFLSAGRGLAAAHRAGVVHRDFKPDNVLIDRDGRVRVTDFGLAWFAASAVSVEGPCDDGNRAAALRIQFALSGSPPYMAPEQLRGEGADARSDVFAFCVSLYEALHGKRPFAGATVRELETSIASGEVHKPPRGSAVPSTVRRVLMQGLQADPAQRFASTEQLVRALEMAARRRGPWRAAALIAAAAASVAVWLAVHAGSVQHPTVLVADVMNETGEGALDGLSGMLITSLEQSRVFSVVTRSRVVDLLNQQGAGGVARIDEALGRSFSKRAGIDALVLTSIRRFGERYALDMKVLDPKKDRYVIFAKEEGRNQDAIPAMIDRMSERVRTDLHEPIDEIHASAKVTDLTTGNLEAYQHYYRADQLITELSFEEAGRELRIALALDPSFALAELRLLIFATEAEGSVINQSLLRLAQSQRVPQRYRLIALAEYRRCEEGRTAEALELYHQALQSDPTDKHTAFEIGDTLLHVYGDRRGAELWFDRVLELDPRYVRALGHAAWLAADERRYDRMLYWGKLLEERLPSRPMGSLFVARAQEALGRVDDAERTLRELLERFPGHWNAVVSLAELHWRQGQFAQAEANLAPLLAPDRSLDDRRHGLRALAHMEARQGLFGRAFRRFDEIAELSRGARDADEAVLPTAEKAFWYAFVRNDLPRARAELDAAVREAHKPSSLAPFAYEVALALGDLERARALNADMRGYRSFAEALAFGRWTDGRRGEAIEILQRLARSGLGPEQVLWSYQLARWALEEKRPDVAIEFLEWMPRVLPRPGGNAFDEQTGEQDALYGPGLFLLGNALEMRGERRRAIDAYSQFLEIWRDADPDDPRPAEARARLATLSEQAADSSSYP